MMKKGFSLMEMVIIVAIISIMTSTMMTTSFKERTTKEIEAAGREVVAAIREAQNNALTGKQQGEGLPCAFRFILDPDTSTYKVQGSYRGVYESCGDDVSDAAYSTVFSSTNLSRSHIILSGYTSNEKLDPDNGHESNFIAFVVPYAKYIDVEVNNPLNPSPVTESLGTEFILEKTIDSENRKYHICVHSTGLIDEIGFVDDDPNSDMECVF